MRLKTYRARTIADAFAQVKKDLGKDAVILHTRSFKVGSFMGFFGKPMVEITASDDVAALGPRQVRAVLGGQAPAAPVQPREPRPAPSPAVARAYGVAHAAPRLNPPGPAVATLEAEPAGRPAPAAEVAHLAIQPPPLHDGLRLELAAIKRMVGQVLQTHATAHAAPAPAMPDALLKHYLAMIEHEVARELADEIAAAIRDELTPAELADEQIVRQAVLRRLEAMIPVAHEIARPSKPADGRPLTVALIGPTGVGKTTTIAKLAATFRLRHGRKVALITSDTYRIAAVDQLRTYANIIGIPLSVALTPAEMSAAVDEHADADVILIDTAGRSPSDQRRLSELRAFLEAARPHQTHLVLSSVASEAALLRTAERFSPLAPGMVIFTKLDEATNFGVLVNVARRTQARLSFITTGQEVPDDIEPSRPDRLARLVLDGALSA
ncbi:MAG: flagellar biosynthesis protein FlhF [Phycisphaerae bacterium]|nr:flagellar biosynthesis protein FlhF [Phycisphaerae bacterium]